MRFASDTMPSAPFLRFRAIFRCVASGLIRIVVRVETNYVDAGRGEHGDPSVAIPTGIRAQPLHAQSARAIRTGLGSQVDIQIVRHDPCVVRRQPVFSLNKFRLPEAWWIGFLLVSRGGFIERTPKRLLRIQKSEGNLRLSATRQVFSQYTWYRKVRARITRTMELLLKNAGHG